MIEYLRMLKDGVRHMSYGDPYEGPTVQASDVVQWAVDEIARLRLNDAEREAIYRASQYLSQNDVFEGMAEDAAALRGLLERLGGVR